MNHLTHPHHRLWRKPCTAALAASALLAGSASAQPSPEKASEDVVTLPEFAVSTVADGGYLATESTSGTRVATQIINLPYSVQVLTEDFIKDFQLLDLDQQAPFVSGMAAGDPATGGGGGTRLRGFFVPYFRNGFYRRQAPDSNSIARTEIVKGPQSAVYGRVSPGGVINYISKKPQTKPASGLSYSIGSYDYERGEGYATGPLVPGKLFYRVDAAYYDFERPTDFWYNRTRNISGGLTWKLSPETSLTFEYEHTLRLMNDSAVFVRWIDSAGVTQASVYDIPDRAVAQRLIEFNTSGAHRRTERLNDSYYVTLEHRFAPDLSLRANIGYSTRDFERNWASSLVTWDTRTTLPANATFLNAVEWTDETKGVWNANRAMNRQTIDDLQYGSQIDLTKVWGGAIKQRSLLTFDIFEDDTQQKTWALTGTALDDELRALGLTTTAQLNAWKRPDPFAPEISGRLPNPAFKPDLWRMTDASTFNLYRFYYGSLFNHTAELLNGRLVLTGSLRQDWSEIKRQQPLSADPELKEAKANVDELTYSFGANYHVIPRKLVAYASYGTAFDPTPQADPNTGELLGNKTAKGVEVGLKGALMDNTMSYTLSAYRVQQENEVTDNPAWVAETDPILKGQLPRFIPGGTTRGEGLSLDVSGRVTENLTLLGNIGWTDIWIHDNKASPALIGTKPLAGQNSPGRSAGVAVRYDIKSGPLKGLKLGANYQYHTRYLRIAGSFNSAGARTATDFYLPEQNEVGAMVSYAHRPSKKITVIYTLNVMNLFDEEEITQASYSPLGREVRFTTSVRF